MSTEPNPFDEIGADGKEKVIESRLEVVPPSVIESLSRAEIDIAISTAKRYPRDIDRALKNTNALACKNAEIAATCTFAVPRGDKTVIGPSVHFARIMMINWGNVNALARVVDCNHDDARLQGVCHDLENNLRMALEIEWPVQAPRPDKEGKIKESRWKDMMSLSKAAGSAVALRRSVFGCIPFALFRSIWKETQLVAAGKGKSFDERRRNMFESFAELKVSDREICEFLGRHGKEAITVEDLVMLYGILTAISDKTTTVEEIFGSRDPKTVKASIPKSKKQEDKSDVKTPEPEARTSQPQEVAAPPQDQSQKEVPVSERQDKRAEAKPESKAPEPKQQKTGGFLTQVRSSMEKAALSEEQVLAQLRNWQIITEKVTTLESIPDKWHGLIIDEWESLVEGIKGGGAA
jgi:hypothetical protein